MIWNVQFCIVTTRNVNWGKFCICIPISKYEYGLVVLWDCKCWIILFLFRVERNTEDNFCLDFIDIWFVLKFHWIWEVFEWRWYWEGVNGGGCDFCVALRERLRSIWEEDWGERRRSRATSLPLSKQIIFLYFHICILNLLNSCLNIFKHETNRFKYIYVYLRNAILDNIYKDQVYRVES